MSAFPNAPAANPGTTDVTVPAGQTTTISPGAYNDLIVNNGATLILEEGGYDFGSWNIHISTNVYFQGPTEVRIAGALTTGPNAVVGPDPNSSGLTASSIAIYVHETAQPPGGFAAQFGQSNTLNVNVYAPNGPITIDQLTQATGVFIAPQVLIAGNVTLTLDSGF